MAEDVKYIQRKGGTVVLYGGHQYYKHTVYKNGSAIWKCSKAKRENCHGTITLKGQEIVKSNIHSCNTDHGKNRIDEAIARMREETRLTNTPVTQIYKKGIDTLKNDGIHFVSPIPAFSSIQTALYTGRNRTNFTNAAEVTIPPQFADFVLADYYHDDSRIIVFCSNDNRQIIKDVEEYFIDGTFQSCPGPFTQLITIHGDISKSPSETEVIPLVYALMTNKTQQSYTALFDVIKSQLKDWLPKKMHLDFEIATANAITSVFPNIVLKKCYFHFKKSIWKKSKEMKIKTKLERRIVGLYTALPLVPEAQISDGLAYIQDMSPNTSKMRLFKKYIKRTWLKNEIFILQWNVYGERHRTNNVVESWNAQLNKKMKRRQPKSILRLLNILVESEKDRDSSSSERRKEYVTQDEYISRLQLQVVNGDITIGHFLEIFR